jgi:phage terminase large subunit-like protein
VDETERGFEQAKRLEQEARDALFRELGGGDDMLQALLQMDDEASQVSVDRGERGRDSSAEASSGYLQDREVTQRSRHPRP